MTRIIAPPMQDLLNTDGIAALNTFWTVTRKDGTVLGFTDWTADVSVGTITYEASSGMSRSALQQRVDLSVPNQEVTGILSSDKVKAGDIRAGKYNGATLDVFMAVPDDPDFLTYGRIGLPGAFLGEVDIQDGMFVFEIRGLSYLLQQSFIELYTPTCRTEFCDSKCKLDIADFTVTGTVTAVPVANFEATGSLVGPGLSTPTPSTGKLFQFGLITFDTGLNAGFSTEIVDQTAINPATLAFYLPTPYPITIGDTFTAVVGCDKTIQRCVQLANAINFRGEPAIPGMSLLFDVGVVAP